MANILFELIVDASPSDVYKAITEETGVKGWWTTDTTLAPQIGSTAEFRFGPGALLFEITELNTNKRVVWKTKQGLPDWDGTNVTFDLEAQDKGTKLLFGHRNFNSEDGTFASTSYNWAYFMMSLKSYLETGKGTPAGA